LAWSDDKMQKIELGKIWMIHFFSPVYFI
jgi:hypothetical protein